jgi:hypothetical protein
MKDTGNGDPDACKDFNDFMINSVRLFITGCTTEKTNIICGFPGDVRRIITIDSVCPIMEPNLQNDNNGVCQINKSKALIAGSKIG